MKRIVTLFISLSLMAALSSCKRAERDAGTDDKNTGSVSVEAGIESETDAEEDMPDREGTGNAAGKEEEPEMAERYDEIPEGCPVILHCGAGVVSVPAYETLIEKRPDIPELSYIDGAPPIKEYNEWLESR